MKLDPHSTASAVRSRRLLFALVCLPVLFALADPPTWWTQRQVLDPNAAKNDYGPANQGQLKNIATKAYAELQAKLPASAWNTPEGQALGVLVTSWNPAQGDNYAPINQGQLKAVAKKFYDVLIQAGYTSACPWTTTTTDDTNYAPANIGQVKNMFAFDLGSTTIDSDGNGLPDNWEIANFGHIGVDPNALAARGDGLTILQAFQQGLDPNDYYNGQTPFPVLRARSGGADKTKCGFSEFESSGTVARIYLKKDGHVWGSIVGVNCDRADPPLSEKYSDYTFDAIAQWIYDCSASPPSIPNQFTPSYSQSGSFNTVMCDPAGNTSGVTTFDALVGFCGGECLEWGNLYGDPPYTSKFCGNTNELSPSWPYIINSPTQKTCTFHLDGQADLGGDPGSYYGVTTANEQYVLSNEYTTEQLVARTQAAMSPIPDLDSPPDPSEEGVFATFQMDPNQSAVNITQSNYQFKWYQSPNLPQYKKIAWVETFYPADDPRTTEVEDTTGVTTVRSWEGTANETPIYYLSPTVQGSYHITSFAAQMTVDGNRNGEMALNNLSIYGPDQTSESKPYRFWLNDDDDTELNVDASPAEIEQVPPNQLDYSKHQIVSKRNLEDFARLWINLGGVESGLTSGTVRIGLKWKTVDSGSPAINIYPSADGDGSDSYLKEDDAAAAQINGVFNTAVIDQNNKQTVDSSGMFIFKTDYWNGLNGNNEKKCFLFEGATEGKGELEVIFLDSSGTQIGEGGSIWLDLKNIKKMYERYDSATGHPWQDVTFEADPNEDQQVIVFVHGWNMSPEGASNFSETLYKRLWQRGYTGRVAAFHWDTWWKDTWEWVPYAGQAIDGYLAHYNDSEYTAWHTGSALKTRLDSLPSGYTKSIVAHSLGNVVVGEALREGMSIDNYALLHAAVPAACYDEDAQRIKQTQQYSYLGFNMWDQLTPDDDSDPPTRALAYRSTFKDIGANISGNIVNFFLPQDNATSFAWEVNNDQTKPPSWDASLDTNFEYLRDAQGSGTKLFKESSISGSIDHYITDKFEGMSYACRTWGKAAGAEGATIGAIRGSNDLSDPAFGGSNGFDTEHSAEFNRNVQSLKHFYDTVLDALQGRRNP